MEKSQEIRNGMVDSRRLFPLSGGDTRSLDHALRGGVLVGAARE